MKKKRILGSIVIVIVVAGAVVGGLLWHNNNTKDTTTSDKKIVQAGTTTKTPTPNVSANTPTTAKTDGTGAVQSTSTDTNGQTQATTDSSSWTTSTSGNITVQQPAAKAKLASGSILSGTAKVSTVHYRLSDDSVGVLTQGTLTVVNGKFSGSLNFDAKASTGRLDVFTTNDLGVESDEIQIGVTF